MYNVAIVGYRMQGSQHHAPAFARLPDCRIVGVCDVVEERAREGAEKYGVTAYTDVDEMLALIFQYLAMLRASVPLPRWVFDECAAIGEMGFRFKDVDEPQDAACGLAQALQLLP